MVLNIPTATAILIVVYVLFTPLDCLTSALEKQMVGFRGGVSLAWPLYKPPGIHPRRSEGTSSGYARQPETLDPRLQPKSDPLPGSLHSVISRSKLGSGLTVCSCVSMRCVCKGTDVEHE